SFGGFCAVTYLSFAPQGLKYVLLTGGIPPIDNGCTANDVYRACYQRVSVQNQKYYERFPEDKNVIGEVVLHLAESEGMGVPLPSGGILTPRGLQLLGLSGLGSSGGFERLHYMFEEAWDPILVPGSKRQLSYTFKRAFENWIGFDTNPLYAMLHEVIYCQGAASQWSAHKIRDEFGNRFNAVEAAKEGRPVFFTGEMVFPWMFDEIGALQPLKEAAHILAEKEDWPQLYDIEKLRKNQVRPETYPQAQGTVNRTRTVPCACGYITVPEPYHVLVGAFPDVPTAYPAPYQYLVRFEAGTRTSRAFPCSLENSICEKELVVPIWKSL
ncbi:hypothetical protein KI387_036891, partial [Taxus chinensis]